MFVGFLSNFLHFKIHSGVKVQLCQRNEQKEGEKISITDFIEN